MGGNDTLHGGNGNDLLYGDEGDDSVAGDAGHDSLFGGAGSDTLEGGAGNDFLHSGSGADMFVFGSGSGLDTVSGFDVATDKLVIASGLNGSNLTTAEAVLASAFFIAGRGLVIGFGGDNGIVLTGVARADLTAANIQISAAEGLSAPADLDVLS